MKLRKGILLGSCLLLLAACCLFALFSRGDAAPMPEPSHWGGYYDDAFVLRLSAPKNGTIYYTTDGSLPTTASPKYRDGIQIMNRSGEPNRYASMQNVVEDWKNYTPDATPLEKGTVIRAVFVNNRGIASDVFTQTYFVGMKPPEQGYILSLIFEEEDLFGDDGIYVTGKEYDDWYLSGGIEEEKPEANFWKRQEVPVIAEILNAQGDAMNQKLGLRLQGNGARAEVKKRFILTARSQYNGSEIFETNFYEGVTTHSVMLKQALPDGIISELVSDRDVSTQGSIPVRVYLNGEYLEDYFMLERYDTHYFRQHYGIDNRVLVKNGILDEDSAANTDIDYYAEFMYWVKNTDFSDPAQWEQFRKEADVQSYIDYMSINYFLCNLDFGDTYNYVLWRSPAPGKGSYGDMRWRWCVYDVDFLLAASANAVSGKGEQLSIFNTEGRADPRYGGPYFGIHAAMKHNPEYCQRFVTSFMDLYNNNFSPEAVGAVLEQYGLTTDWNNGYFEKRPAYAVKHIAEEFNLTGSLETVTVTCQHPEMGEVTVNTSQIDLSGGSWEGQYFTDYPITITAEPKDGYQFLGWKGDANQASSTLTVAVDGGITLEPVFAKNK